jgi:hypothetical protein
MQSKSSPPDWPKALLDAFHERRVVIFAGSGLSSRARSRAGQAAPTWSGLLAALLKEAKQRNYIGNPKRVEENAKRVDELDRMIASNSVDDFLIAANYIVDKFTRNNGDMPLFIHHLLSKYIPDEAHEIVVSLPVIGFISTNYDSYLEDEFSKQNRENLSRYSAHDESSLSIISQVNKRWLIKLHGQVGFSEHFVLSFDEYEKAYSSGRLEILLSTILTKYTVLFIGFGFRDPPIMNMLRSTLRRLGPASNRHYALGDDQTLDTIKSRFLLEKFNIEAIHYEKLARDPTNPTLDLYVNFLMALRNLRKQVRHAQPPSVRVLIDFRFEELEKKTYVYMAKTKRVGHEVWLWPSLEWPHLPPKQSLSEVASKSFLNAMREQFGIDRNTCSKMQIQNVDSTFIDQNKENILDDGNMYDFYFQFVTINVHTKDRKSLHSALSKSMPGIELKEAEELHNHANTMLYNGNVVRRFHEI